MKSLNIRGAIKTATSVPTPCAIHCWIGGVRRRKPVLKSWVKSVDWLAPMLAKAPPRRFSFWAFFSDQPSDLVAPPRITWEAFDAAVKGVISILVLVSKVRGSASYGKLTRNSSTLDCQEREEECEEN
jgi:hypothetical protein